MSLLYFSGQPRTPIMPTMLPTPVVAFTISLVEDEPILLEEMAFVLRQFGFTVECFSNALQFYRYLLTKPQTIAVLDIGLGDEDGLSMCRHIRAHDSAMGIVFVTARGLRSDRLEGLSVGADGYLVKPVDMEELVLILRRLSRRFEPPEAATPPLNSPFARAEWQMDKASGQLIAPNGQRVRLTLNEIKLLEPLLEKSPGIASHGELLVSLGLLPDEFNKHRIEVIASRLREKVLRSSGLALPLHSSRGIGYRLSSNDE